MIPSIGEKGEKERCERERKVRDREGTCALPEGIKVGIVKERPSTISRRHC